MSGYQDDSYFEYEPVEVDPLEEKVDAIGQYIVDQHQGFAARQRDQDWDRLYQDHPELESEEGATPVAEAIETLAERAGNPELMDNPQFARAVYEVMGAQAGEPEGEPEGGENIFQKIWTDQQRTAAAFNRNLWDKG
jgi:hypothetical protein